MNNRKGHRKVAFFLFLRSTARLAVAGNVSFSPLRLQKTTIQNRRIFIENFVIFSEIMLDK